MATGTRDHTVAGGDELSVGDFSSTKPVAVAGQNTRTPPGDCSMLNSGAPGVCTTESKLQNPPVREKSPPLIAGPASGWPMVPLTENTPPVLVPPPPSIVCQSIEYC